MTSSKNPSKSTPKAPSTSTGRANGSRSAKAATPDAMKPQVLRVRDIETPPPSEEVSFRGSALLKQRETGKAANAAGSAYVGDPAAAMLAYVPRRSTAGTRERDLTLQTGFIPPCLPMTAPVAP